MLKIYGKFREKEGVWLFSKCQTYVKFKEVNKKWTKNERKWKEKWNEKLKGIVCKTVEIKTEMFIEIDGNLELFKLCRVCLNHV